MFDRIRPSTVGWICMKNAFDFGNYCFEFLDDARRFDCGSYNVAGVLGLGAAVDLVLEAGIEKIARRVLGLTDRLVEGLRAKGYTVVSSRRPGEASGIVAFRSDRHDHTAVQRALRDERRIILAVREARLRSSPHYYNSEDEIDALLAALP
jgi:selenocysteine lyase/cysteine desulfurase